MREIKFRVWNKIEKKMVYYDKDCSSPDMTLNGVLIAHQDQSNVSYVYGLMQFTGLKDKNGKEIYAGDIAKVKHCVKPYGGEVYFDTDLARFAIKDKDVCKPLNFIGTPLDKENIYEIIGNVHQHPKLMENNKEAGEAK